MIELKSKDEIAKMRRAGEIAAKVLAEVASAVKPGIKTKELDKLAEQLIKSQGAIALFKGYNGFPASICVSINEEVVHGIPGKREIHEGDIVGIDLGVNYDGYCSDIATTVMVGEVGAEKKKLVEVTREALNRAIKICKNGNKIGDVAHAVQSYVEENGYSVVRALAGHGIGKNMHEDPEVPNYGKPGFGVELKPGMVIAIEPMVNMGGYEVMAKNDNWTIVTSDSKPSAHFEHTVAVTENSALVLTDLTK